jgi:hypothetical protein
VGGEEEEEGMGGENLSLLTPNLYLTWPRTWPRSMWKNSPVFPGKKQKCDGDNSVKCHGLCRLLSRDARALSSCSMMLTCEV